MNALNGSSLDYSDPPKKRISKLDASSPQPINKSAGKPPSFHPPEIDHTLKTIEIADDLGSIDVNATNLESNFKRRGATHQPVRESIQKEKQQMSEQKSSKMEQKRGSQYSYEESQESERSDDSEVFVGLDSSRYGRSNAKKSKKLKNLQIKTKYEEQRAVNIERINRERESLQPPKPASTKNSRAKEIAKLNQEPEYSQKSSLNDRAVRMVCTEEYLYKVKEIKSGNTHIKSMEFIMDGIKIELPYTGGKVTQGYLKKQQNTSTLLMSKQFQMRYCILDLTKFVFKYAKAPTEQYTFIHLKDIVDIILEKDPTPKETSQARSSSFFSSGSKKDGEGFNFVIRMTQRDYRMQANTKTEQIMWARAFTILFELRARVSQNLKTTLDINNHLGITGINATNFSKLQQTLGEYDYDTITRENKKYLGDPEKEELEKRGSLQWSTQGRQNQERQSRAQTQVTMNDKLRKEFKKPKMNSEFKKNPLKKDTLIPTDVEEDFDPEVEAEIEETKRKTREAQEALQKKKDELAKKMEANKKLMQATMKLNQFQKLMLSPIRGCEVEEEQKSQTTKIEFKNYSQNENLLSPSNQPHEEEEYYDEEYDEEEPSPKKNQTKAKMMESIVQEKQSTIVTSRQSKMESHRSVIKNETARQSKMESHRSVIKNQTQKMESIKNLDSQRSVIQTNAFEPPPDSYRSVIKVETPPRNTQTPVPQSQRSLVKVDSVKSIVKVESIKSIVRVESARSIVQVESARSIVQIEAFTNVEISPPKLPSKANEVSEVTDLVQQFQPPGLNLDIIEHEIANPIQKPPKIKLSSIRKKIGTRGGVNDSLNDSKLLSETKVVNPKDLLRQFKQATSSHGNGVRNSMVFNNTSGGSNIFDQNKKRKFNKLNQSVVITTPQDSNRDGSVLSMNSSRSKSNLTKIKGLSETAKSILRKKKREADEMSNNGMNYSSVDMVQDISGILNKDLSKDTNPMILEDIDDYPEVKSPSKFKTEADELNLIIKSYEKQASFSKNPLNDSSEKKLERQNSRKKNLLENSGITSGRRQSGVMASSEVPPVNMDRQNRFSDKAKIKIPVSVAKQLGIAKSLSQQQQPVVVMPPPINNSNNTSNVYNFYNYYNISGPPNNGQQQ